MPIGMRESPSSFAGVTAEAWKPGLDLFRVESQGMRDGVRPPDGQTLYAGSVFGLGENTAYEVKLSLIDPDGGNAERIVPMTTWAEPRLAAGSPAIDVTPDSLRARPGSGQTGADVAAALRRVPRPVALEVRERRKSRSASSRRATAKWCWTAGAAIP